MKTVYLDAGYLISLEVASDQNYTAATSHWRAQRSSKSLQMVTTSYVFDEIVTFLNAKGQHVRAVKVGERLLKSRGIQLVDVDRALFDAGWLYFQQHHDKLPATSRQNLLPDRLHFVCRHEPTRHSHRVHFRPSFPPGRF